MVSIMKKTLWLKVTKDIFEFPILITDTAVEMARLNGTTAVRIRNDVSKYNRNLLKSTPYRKVLIEIGDEDAETIEL